MKTVQCIAAVVAVCFAFAVAAQSSTPAANVSAGTFGANTGGGTYVFSGNTGFGTSSPLGLAHLLNGAMYIETNIAGSSVYGLSFRKARGAAGSPAAVAAEDGAGFIGFNGYDGSTYRGAAMIRSDVDGAPGASSVPGRIAFLTSTDTSGGVVERMRITSAGNVGIGSTVPGAKLHVSAPTNQLRLQDSDTSGASAHAYLEMFDSAGTRMGYFGDGFSTANLGIYADTGYGFAIFTNGLNERLRIDTSGKLTVNGAANFGITALLATGDLVNFATGIGVQRFGYGQIPHVTFTAARGTEAAPTALSIADETGYLLFRGYDGVNTPIGSARVTGIVDGTVTPGLMPQAIAFKTGNGNTPTEKMRVSSAGDVGIGTATPLSRLDILGVASTTNSARRIMRLTDDASMAQGVGAGVDLAGKYNTFSAVTSFGNLMGVKANATDGDKTGNVIVSAGNSTGTMVEVAKFAPGQTDITGNLHVSGDISGVKVINAVYQDIAEWVPATEDLEPGTVVVLNPLGTNEVMSSHTAYDTTVAGVVSPQPGIVLGIGSDSKEKVATTGRVRVRVDATRRPVQVGDLLVTSDTRGVAMVSEAVEIAGIRMHRPGTILGKALEPLAGRVGEVLVLLSLQ